MTVLTGKLVSIGGEPFGGQGHAVRIFSRVPARASQVGDSVILQLVDRIPMPSPDDPETPGDGTFVTRDMDPGPIRVELEGSALHGEGWDINLPEPEGDEIESWSLAELLDLQVEWEPVVVSRAESAARQARRYSEVAVESAGVTSADRQHIDSVVEQVMTDAAGMVRDEVRSDADRAGVQAGVATEQAGLAGQHREGAEDAEESAHSAAGAAAGETAALIRGEMNSKVDEAEGHAQAAGLSAQASESSAVDSSGSAQESGQSAQAASTHEQATRDLKTGIDEWFQDDLLPTAGKVGQDAQAASTAATATAADRVATGQDRTATQGYRNEAKGFKDAAETAAENAQTGAPPGGWVKEDFAPPVRESLNRADSALQHLPSATENARGGIRLSGDLGGDAENPTVPALAGKAAFKHRHDWSDLDEVPALSRVGHGHGVEDVDGLDQALADRPTTEVVEAMIRESQSTHWWDGEGVWVAPEWAGPNDVVINTDTGEIHSVEEMP